MSFPALEYLKSRHTEVWISSPVVPLVQFADQTRSLAASGIELLGVGDIEIPSILGERLASFDEIVSWYGSKRPEFRDALRSINPRCVFHPALPDGTLHAIDFFARQVGAPEGLCPHLGFSFTPAKRDAVVIHPFSGSGSKNWPLHQFQAMAERLPCAVEWVAGPEQVLAGAMRFENLLELAEHIAGARLYIGNDSGITHLAAATGVPALALFGPTDPAIWAPRSVSVTVLCAQPIESLPLGSVLSTANRMLGAR